MALRFRRTSIPRKRRRPPPGAVPSTLTLSNGVCGVISIAFSTNALIELPPHRAIFFAAVFVFIGMLFDMMDGQVARRLNQMSSFGTQLDSLSDAVTFGAAPVFILLGMDGFFPKWLLFPFGIMHLVCVLLRLARFNVQTDENDTHEFFSGLPSPAAAGVITSFAIGLHGLHRWDDPGAAVFVQEIAHSVEYGIMFAAPLLSLVISALMVSKISYRHIATRWRGRRFRYYQLTRGAIIILATVLLHELALALAFCIFAFEPAINALIRKIRMGGTTPDPVGAVSLSNSDTAVVDSARPESQT